MRRPPSVRSLEALLEKYREILRMREEHAAAPPGHDPRREMRALAERFPGALRELDRMPLDEIARRIDVLGAVLRHELSAPDWAVFMIGYHGHMRAALRIKRMCLGCTSLDEAVERVRAQYRPLEDEPSFDAIGREGVQAIIRPEQGRLHPWVLRQVGDGD